ncbi:MAG: hypothetical protein ABJL99_05165 [Aliishimia sp.]
MQKYIIVLGSGHAAMCAGIAALETGTQVFMLEKVDQALAPIHVEHLQRCGEQRSRFWIKQGEQVLGCLPPAK